MKRDYSNYGSWLVNEGSGCTRADKIDAVAAFNAKRQKLRSRPFSHEIRFRNFVESWKGWTLFPRFASLCVAGKL